MLHQLEPACEWSHMQCKSQVLSQNEMNRVFFFISVRGCCEWRLVNGLQLMVTRLYTE